MNTNLFISKDILHKSKKQGGLKNNTIIASRGQAVCNGEERKSTFISLNGWFTIEGENSLQLVSHHNHSFWERNTKKISKRRPSI